VSNGSALAATAILTLPGKPQPPAALAQLRDAVWRELGQSARMRYDAFGEATQRFEMSRPHYHLNMIGVRRSHHGQGLARQLLDAVHELSQNDAVSHGVTLTTEDFRNVPLYEHFGYEIVGHARIDAQLETWLFFRPKENRE
jgi:GNAT superfamily N-acetyltransferase